MITTTMTTEPTVALPSARALGLERSSAAELERSLVRGATPDVEQLIGWEFRGINHPTWARIAGIKKFVKGFFRHDDGRVMGYNSPVEQNVLDGRWRVRTKRFGFYEVAPVDPTARDNEYLHALLLDYGRGGNPSWDPSSGIRDYLVALSDDILLGKAYYAIGGLRVRANFFVLERFRRARGAS